MISKVDGKYTKYEKIKVSGMPAHVNRMNDDRLLHIAKEYWYTPIGRRSLSRPRKRCAP